MTDFLDRNREMGGACTCSRSSSHIIDSSRPLIPIPNPTLPESDETPTVSELLTAYLRTNQAGMHRKVVELFYQGMRKEPDGLREISLSSLTFKSQDWEHLCALVHYSRHLHTLQLTQVYSPTGSLRHFTVKMNLLRNLKELELVEMRLFSFDLRCFSDELRLLVSLKLLNLSGNSLKLDHFLQIFPSILALKGMTILILDDNGLGSEGARLISRHLSALPLLRELSYKYNAMGSEGLRALLPMMVKRQPHVSVDGNDLSDDEYHMIRKVH